MMRDRSDEEDARHHTQPLVHTRSHRSGSAGAGLLSSSSSPRLARFLTSLHTFLIRRKLLLLHWIVILYLSYYIHTQNSAWNQCSRLQYQAQKFGQERWERCSALRRIEEVSCEQKVKELNAQKKEQLMELANGMKCEPISQVILATGCQATSYRQTPPLPALPQPSRVASSTFASSSGFCYLTPGSPYYTRAMDSLYTSQMYRLTETEGVFDRYEDPRVFESARNERQWWNSVEDQQPSEIIRRMKKDAEVEDEKAAKNRLAIRSDLLKFDPALLRDSTTPALWIEGSDQIDGLPVKWNAAAEARFSQLIRAQQWPVPAVDCTKQKYVVVRQWFHGFFSRYDLASRAFLRLLGATDRMIILGYHSMQHPDAPYQAAVRDDFLGEGLLQYFTPWSQCQNHPYVVEMISRGDKNMTEQFGVPLLDEPEKLHAQLREHSSKQFILFQYLMQHNVPVPSSHVRRAIFDYGPARQQTEERYQAAVKLMDAKQLEEARQRDEWTGLASPTQRLTSTRLGAAAGSVWKHVTGLDLDSHLYEQIYGAREAKQLHINTVQPSSVCQSDSPRTCMYNEWLAHMMHAYLWQLTPRIQIQRNMITEYWSDVIMKRQYGINTAVPTQEGKSPVNVHHLFGDGQFAVLRIRRGDKVIEDPYAQVKGHYRHASLFLHTLHKRELAQGWKFKGIYLQTDDAADMVRLLSYSKIATEDEKMSTVEEITAAYATKDDDKITRAHLKGRWLLYNHLSPSSCEVPSSHVGYEAFLASISWMLHHRCFIVGHEDSNISKFLARMAHVQQNLQADESRGTPRNARHVDVGDTFEV